MGCSDRAQLRHNPDDSRGSEASGRCALRDRELGRDLVVPAVQELDETEPVTERV
jgi:hypothetical protein